MIEIRYKDQYEVTDLAGCTVSEARSRYQEELGIPAKAYVKLNGSKLKAKAEAETVINDDDRLSFGVSHHRGVYYLTALLLALAITGGVFASGFLSDTVQLTVTAAESNFADVSANNTPALSWNITGGQKGSIGSGYLFNVDPATGYTGDLVVTVTIGNASDLAKYYRVLSLNLGMVYSGNLTDVDISAGNGNTYTLLTLDNGSASMYVPATANMSVKVNSGFFIAQAHPAGGWTGSPQPQLFCQVSQR